MQAEAMGPAGMGLGSIGLTQPGVSGARGSDASAAAAQLCPVQGSQRPDMGKQPQS